MLALVHGNKEIPLHRSQKGRKKALRSEYRDPPSDRPAGTRLHACSLPPEAMSGVTARGSARPRSGQCLHKGAGSRVKRLREGNAAHSGCWFGGRAEDTQHPLVPKWPHAISSSVPVAPRQLAAAPCASRSSWIRAPDTARYL